MKTIVVIVTYGNRFCFLEKVINSVFDEGIQKIIVIDNNSVEESRMKLKEYEDKNKEKIKVVYLDDNYGSAGGFKRGLQEAYNDNNCDFIWLLDDDNTPKKGAYIALVDFWEKNKMNKHKNILISLRKDRRVYFDSIKYDDPEILIGKPNSFMQFDILEYLKNKFRKRDEDDSFLFGKNYGESYQAPYGGMFLNKKLIDIIGYPNEKFFLYTDDTEYSYRVIQNDGKIYVVLNSLIEDIDTSWQNTSNKNFFSLPVLDTEFDFRVFYSFRNRTFFEIKNRVNNKFLYFLNMLIFLSFIFLFALLRFDFKRFRLVCKATYDGLLGDLGKKEDFN
ncbi:glycosyl transferase family 2 [Chloroherpeton thalassium ATCC 35110]|uniref:Glycosyl transferase family 2 n=1 Tax=Chloroherpeton thalassium (strain ATCC 35110 / GB-78) TaxID=517418 RepID=B3QV19_CHLT3|nr:glycosyltransferase [Chloroherpeton thalassium]ACF14520.1 glycosyl transferase family 2 [Chloroherpeton thalassium ATCC 35110]